MAAHKKTQWKEKKHISWHGVVGYEPSLSRIRKGDNHLKEENPKIILGEAQGTRI